MQPSATQTWRRPFIGAAVAVPPERPGRHEPLRGRRLRAQQRGRGLPQPDVPLPAARDPLRRLEGRPAATATRSTWGRCTPTPAARCALKSADPATKPALRFNYLSTEQDRREWVEAIRVARRILGQPAFEPFNGGETSPGPAVETDEEILDWVAKDAETALHPSCTAAMGTAPGVGARPAVRCASTASTGCAWSTRRRSRTSPTATSTRPVMMLAEKAADLVAGNTPLAPGARAVLPPPARRVGRRSAGRVMDRLGVPPVSGQPTTLTARHRVSILCRPGGSGERRERLPDAAA